MSASPVTRSEDLRSDNRPMKVWLDGRVVDGTAARIPVTDHGFLYGDGVFEGLRVTGGGVFRLGDHMNRLQASARATGIELPGGPPGLERIVIDTARAYGRAEAYVRLIVTRGSGGLGVDPDSCDAPRVVCIATELTLYSPEKLARGIDLLTASLRRPASDALDPRVKSLNYLNSVLARREAKLRGADEALLLGAGGQVAEASVANVFAVTESGLVTPPKSDGALGGIVRQSVLELAPELGLRVREETIGRFDLFAADEVFLTGTGARFVPVATLDGQHIGGAGASRAHPVTERITRAFPAFARKRTTPF